MKHPPGKAPLPADLIAALGPLAFASRLKRLQENVLRDAERVYEHFEAGFQPRWFLLIYALSRHAPASVTELAETLGLSHAAIHQIAREVIEAGMVRDARHATDDRRRLLRLTDRGRARVRRLEPLWDDIRTATLEVLSEADGDLLAAMDRVEAALQRRGVFARVAAHRGVDTRPPVVIDPYRPALKKHFYELNREWLETYFTVEPEDQRLLTDPKRRIINRGGTVIFARLDEEIVGTCALIRHDDHTYELAKMAVTPQHQGQGIGRKLGEAIIDEARVRGGRRLILLTSRKLEAALALYERLGFGPSAAAADLAAKYARCTIAMEMKLNPKRSRKSGRTRP